MPPADAIASAIVSLLDQRHPGVTICPSEVARALASGREGSWRTLMPNVRQVAQAMADDGRLVVTRRGLPVEATSPGGPIRLGRPPAAADR